MALDDAKAFLEQMQSNLELRSEVLANGNQFFQVMLASGQKHGYSFTKADLFNALRAKFNAVSPVATDQEANCIVWVAK